MEIDFNFIFVLKWILIHLKLKINFEHLSLSRMNGHKDKLARELNDRIK